MRSKGLRHRPGARIAHRDVIHAGEGEAGENPARGGAQRTYAQAVADYPARPQPHHDHPQRPIRHLHETVVVLKQPAAPNQHHVAAQCRPAQGHEPAQPWPQDLGATVPPPVGRLCRHDYNCCPGRNGAQPVAGRLQNGPIAEIAIDIARQQQNGGAANFAFGRQLTSESPRVEGPVDQVPDPGRIVLRTTPMTHAPRSGIPLLEARDLVTLAALPAMILLSWLLPEKAWEPVARATARVHLLCRREWHAWQEAHVDRYIGTHLGPNASSSLVQAVMTNHRLAQLQTLRCHRLGSWRPPLTLEGRAHLDAALEQGHGAILWVAPLVFGPLVTKMAFHAAGYRLTHLSRFTHGYSKSLWGARLINGIRTRAENRFLAERVVIGADGATAVPKRVLAERLQLNGIVSISVGADGARTVTVPFLDGQIRLATGAVTLMQKTRAPLLPVFTIQRDDGRFAAVVEPPLGPTAGADRDEVAVVAARAFAAMLESYALRWPDQLVWHYDILRLASGTGIVPTEKRGSQEISHSSG